MSIVLNVFKDQLEFVPAQLIYLETGLINLFAHKNNKTVAETLAGEKYAHLADQVHRDFQFALAQPLGVFLLELKNQGNQFYRRFLNKYGDLTYCKFSLAERLPQKGLYIYILDGKICYIGRSHDPFDQRINAGYGHISPKNCYLDGQATNCHLNALIARRPDAVQFFIYPMRDDLKIDRYEAELIRYHQPEWNIALRR